MGSLRGRTVIVTQARHQAAEFIRLLEGKGARAVAVPTIEIAPPESWDSVDDAIQALETYDWLIVTSVNGVKFFLQRLGEKKGGLEGLKGLKVGAVGPKTRDALLQEGLKVHFMPAVHTAEALVAESTEDWRGKKVLFARAARGRDAIPEGLGRLGAAVTVAAAYRNVKPEVSRAALADLLSAGTVDAVTFSSGSAVSNFVDLFEPGEAKRLLEGVAVACIGPVTAAAADEHGLAVDVLPARYTIPALAEALEEHFAAKSV